VGAVFEAPVFVWATRLRERSVAAGDLKATSLEPNPRHQQLQVLLGEATVAGQLLTQHFGKNIRLPRF
jgi:hypothetical protein